MVKITNNPATKNVIPDLSHRRAEIYKVLYFPAFRSHRIDDSLRGIDNLFINAMSLTMASLINQIL
jgi:hypothetical protein